MAAIIKPNLAQITDLGVLLGAIPWSTAKLHLCTTNFNPSPTNVIGDFTPGEATFVGYAAKTLTWTLPYIDSDGNVVSNSSATFIMTAATTPNVVYVVYITDSAGAVLLASWVLDTPMSFSVVNDGISIEPYIQLLGGIADQTP